MYFEAALCEYLREQIFPQFAPPPYGEIEMTSLGVQKPVCLFFEKNKNIMVVGKFFKRGVVTLEEAWLGAHQEYSNLKLLREQLGMDGDTDKVVAPLGESKELSALLVTERASGQTLDYYIARAIFEQRHDELFQALSNLARFFVRLHEVAKTQSFLSPEAPRFYLDTLLDSLTPGLIDSSGRTEIENYAAKWWQEKGVFSSDRETVVHGDATPTNFFLNSDNVTAIDLESMKWADRCWDLGFIAAELKHHFLWRTDNGWAAEPFIGHFLWQYVTNYGDRQFFDIITRKLPLYMALGLLRISRNSYIGDAHMKRLVTEAKQCLKYGL